MYYCESWSGPNTDYKWQFLSLLGVIIVLDTLLCDTIYHHVLVLDNIRAHYVCIPLITTPSAVILPLKGHAALSVGIRVCLVLGRKGEALRHGAQQHLRDADPVICRVASQQGLQLAAAYIGRRPPVQLLRHHFQQLHRDVPVGSPLQVCCWDMKAKP